MRWQRERMVCGKRHGASATSTSMVCAAGSSSVLSKALAAAPLSASAGSMVATCQPPNWLDMASLADSSRIWSITISLRCTPSLRKP